MLTEAHTKEDLQEIRDLAKKLAMSFGIDLSRIRKPVVALHMSVTQMFMTSAQCVAFQFWIFGP